MSDETPRTDPPEVAAGDNGNPPRGAVHWLVRIAERAGYAEQERPDLAPGA
jgi:hypothetical protein